MSVETSQELWGGETRKAVANFPVSGERIPVAVVRWLGRIKGAAARANADLGLLDTELAQRIAAAADEIAQGRHDDQFPIDVFQTGSGTSSNMNANEVIANLAGEGAHPNDHVNMGQSSNDVFPSAVHLAALDEASNRLLPALERLEKAFADKAEAFKDIVKSGRTHLMDAVPVTLGQEFAGYAAQIRLGRERVQSALPHVAQIPLGGTATGTGLNTHRDFAVKVRETLSADTGLEIRPPEDPFEAQANRDALVELSGALKVIAVSLTKIANDLALMGSGPRAGIGEIFLPELQKGSSIMPGKVNPVLPEVVLQVSAQVIGNDTAITVGGAPGAVRAQRPDPADGAQPAPVDPPADHGERAVRLQVRRGDRGQPRGLRGVGGGHARRRHRAQPVHRLRQGGRHRQGRRRQRPHAARGGARARRRRGDARRGARPAQDRGGVRGIGALLHRRPALAAVAGALTIAFSAILVSLAEVEPATAAVFRCLYALPVLGLLAWLEDRRYGPRPMRARRLALPAGIFFAADLVFWHYAIGDVGAGLSTVLGNLQVVVVPLLAWLILGERIQPRLLVALPLVCSGVVLISGVLETGAFGDDPARGVLFGILTGLTYAGFILVLRQAGSDLRRPAGPLFDTTFVATVMAAIAGLAIGDVDLVPAWPAHGWLVVLALTSQVIGWLLITVSLPRLRPRSPRSCSRSSPSARCCWA